MLVYFLQQRCRASSGSCDLGCETPELGTGAQSRLTIPFSTRNSLRSLHVQRCGNHRREASTHFALRHDRVVRVIAFGIGERLHPPCLIMERMQGSLYDFIGTNPSPVDLCASLSYIIDICEVSVSWMNVGVSQVSVVAFVLPACASACMPCDLFHLCTSIVCGMVEEWAGTKLYVRPKGSSGNMFHFV